MSYGQSRLLTYEFDSSQESHFMYVFTKERLHDRLLRTLSAAQLREVLVMIRRAVDPDVLYAPAHP
jgi:hypothetical protein